MDLLLYLFRWLDDAELARLRVCNHALKSLATHDDDDMDTLAHRGTATDPVGSPALDVVWYGIGDAALRFDSQTINQNVRTEGVSFLSGGGPVELS